MAQTAYGFIGTMLFAFAVAAVFSVFSTTTVRRYFIKQRAPSAIGVPASVVSASTIDEKRDVVSSLNGGHSGVATYGAVESVVTFSRPPNRKSLRGP